MTIRLFYAIAAGAIALGLNPSVSVAQTPALHHIDLPDVPTDFTVEEGNVAFLEGRAVGTQNYICLPMAGGFKWTFTGPQATLFLSLRGELQQQMTTHFLSPNPEEGYLPRVAPSTGCAQASDVGVVALVPYGTDYTFYRARNRR